MMIENSKYYNPTRQTDVRWTLTDQIMSTYQFIQIFNDNKPSFPSASDHHALAQHTKLRTSQHPLPSDS